MKKGKLKSTKPVDYSKMFDWGDKSPECAPFKTPDEQFDPPEIRKLKEEMKHWIDEKWAEIFEGSMEMGGKSKEEILAMWRKREKYPIDAVPWEWAELAGDTTSPRYPPENPEPRRHKRSRKPSADNRGRKEKTMNREMRDTFSDRAIDVLSKMPLMRLKRLVQKSTRRRNTARELFMSARAAFDVASDNYTAACESLFTEKAVLAVRQAKGEE